MSISALSKSRIGRLVKNKNRTPKKGRGNLKGVASTGVCENCETDIFFKPHGKDSGMAKKTDGCFLHDVADGIPGRC